MLASVAPRPASAVTMSMGPSLRRVGRRPDFMGLVARARMRTADEDWAGPRALGPGVREQVGGDGDQAGAEVLAEALGLGVGAGGAGDAGGEQAVGDEVDGEEGRQLVAVDLEAGRLGEELAEPVRGQVAAQPLVRARADGPQAHVGGAALVAGTRAAQAAERDALGRAGGLGGRGGSGLESGWGRPGVFRRPNGL